MAYIGNEPRTANFPVDYFTGNGTTTTFNMQVAPASPSAISVAIDGVVQAPSTYSVDVLQLIFTEAPPATIMNNIVVVHLGKYLDIGVPSDSTVTYPKIQTVTANKLLGRTTESSGTVQEITLGSGLSITGGILNASPVTTLTTAVLANATTFTVAHGLGRRPFLVIPSLVVSTSNNEWAVDDEIYRWIDGLTGVADSTINVGADATNIIATVNNSNVAITKKTTGGNSAAPVTNFRLRFRVT